jgi:tyrosyl-tRNA synthetase
MYGKLMSISDDLMWRYWTLLTDLRQSEVDRMRSDVEGGSLHPMEAKKRLARTIVSDFHSGEAAQTADENWARQFQERDLSAIAEEAPVDLRLVAIGDAASLERLIADPSLPVRIHMAKLLVALGLKNSRTEAERQVKSGVRIDGVISTSMHLDIPSRPARLAIEVGRHQVAAVIR